jgi:hypothetical protein
MGAFFLFGVSEIPQNSDVFLLEMDITLFQKIENKYARKYQLQILL